MHTRTLRCGYVLSKKALPGPQSGEHIYLSYSAQDRACYQRYERQRAVHIFAKRIKSLAEGLFYALADRLNGGLFFQHPEEHHRLYITTFSAKFPVLKLTDFYSNKNTV